MRYLMVRGMKYLLVVERGAVQKKDLQKLERLGLTVIEKTAGASVDVIKLEQVEDE